MNLFIDSQLEWPETLACKNPAQLAINFRIPCWVEGGNVRISGAALPAFPSPGNCLTLNRLWKSGDKIELSLPMGLTIDSMPDNQIRLSRPRCTAPGAGRAL